MNKEHVAWGAASMLVKRHGYHAPVIVAKRVGELVLAGDMEGVAMWKDIAVCMDQLTAFVKTGQNLMSAPFLQ